MICNPPFFVSVPSSLKLVLLLLLSVRGRDACKPGDRRCGEPSLLRSVEALVSFGIDRLLLRLKRFDSLERLRVRLRSAKRGRRVMRQAQRMAIEGSTCDLWKMLESAFLY